MADEGQTMTQQELEALLAGSGNPPYNPKKEAAVLARDVALYHEGREPFEQGQIVRQRIGLCVQQRKFAAMAYGFVQYLDEKDVVVVKFPEYHNLDCVLAQPDVEGDAHFFLADSRRYEAYPQDDLEAAGAEASKAVN